MISTPERWYMVWWGIAGVTYLALQGVVTYYAVYKALDRRDRERM